MKQALFVLAWGVGLAACASGGDNQRMERRDRSPAAPEKPATPAEPPADLISVDSLMEHVFWLADDARGGRDTMSEGIAQAAQYLSDRFADAGLLPLPGTDSYLAPYPLGSGGYDPSGTSLTLGESLPLQAGVDFRPFGFSSDAAVTGDIVFAGYGISAPELSYDDYEGLDVTGKVVFLLRHAPPDGPGRKFSETEHSYFQVKARNAREHGAVGMILVSDPRATSRPDDFRLPRGLHIPRPPEPDDEEEEEEPDVPFVAVHVSQHVAEELLGPSRTLAEVQGVLDAGTPAKDIVVSMTASLAVQRFLAPEIVTARNVVGFLPGTDPELRDEWVVIGAHYDHLGEFSSDVDTTYNGADDNASGTAGVLELARYFGAVGSPRSLVFVGFSGEERGLLGSRSILRQADESHEHTVIDDERVVFMLNLDMIGRNAERPVDVYGDGFTPGLRSRVEAANAVDLNMRFRGQQYISASDHHPFFARGIPVMFFFTGLHGDYHDIGDEAGKIAYQRMDRIVEVAARLIAELASGERLHRRQETDASLAAGAAGCGGHEATF